MAKQQIQKQSVKKRQTRKAMLQLKVVSDLMKVAIFIVILHFIRERHKIRNQTSQRWKRAFSTD